MEIVKLKDIVHDIKIGDICGSIEPNILEDCFFEADGEVVGFYIKDISKYSEKAARMADIANVELRSERVPKSNMGRSSGFRDGALKVQQYSTIIGSCPPRPHMNRPYATISSVHKKKTAQNFIKAMILLCRESEGIIRELTPHIYERQLKIINTNVPEKWRLSRLFTSSISNYNIPAAFHRDAGNLEGCVNVIITKREGSKGGNLNIPDYGATVNQCDNSLLVYPAWRNVHGVTPIIPTREGGYRNSLVFYPLKAFKGQK